MNSRSRPLLIIGIIANVLGQSILQVVDPSHQQQNALNIPLETQALPGGYSPSGHLRRFDLNSSDSLNYVLELAKV